MLIAISKYTKPLAEVDVYRPAHHEYIKPLFSARKLLVAGRQKPAHVGGVIIAMTLSLEEFREVLDNDPFTKAGVAVYNIVEFTPGFHHDSISDILKML